MDELILFLNFIIEIGKYIIGAKILFNTSMKRKRTLIYAVLAALIVLGVFPLQSNEQYIITYIIAVIVSYIMITDWKIKDVVHVVLLTLGLVCLDGIVEMVIIIFLEKGAHRILINSVVVILFMLVVYLICFKVKLQVKEYIKGKALEYIWIFVACMIVNILFTSTGLYVMRDFLADGIFKTCIQISNVMSYFSVIILVIFMVYIRNANAKLKKVVSIEKQVHKMEKQYYQSLLKKEEATRKNRHDWNNHLICIAELAAKENAVETTQYIERLVEQLKNIQGKRLEVGHSIIDALLNFYLADMDEEINIKIKGMCKYKIDIESVDLCVIFSNLLKNAVEYLEKSTLDKKELMIKLQQGEKFTQIQIVNNVDNNVSITDINRTSKSDKLNHGIGLENVRQAIQRNGGILRLDVKEQSFIVEVVLKNK